MKQNYMRKLAVTVAGIATITMLVSCSAAGTTPEKTGSQAPTAPSYAPGANAKIVPSDVKYLPNSVKDQGTLSAATTDGNAPWSFVDAQTNKPTGADVDIMNEVASRLGLKVNWSVVQFPAGIPGVQAGRYDFYLSAMADTKAREELVNFIAYSKEASGVIVPKGNPLNIKTLNDLCGKKVSIITGTLFTAFLADLNKKCTTPMTVSETPDQTAPKVAVASGQADATLDTFGVSNYLFSTATEGIQTKLELAPVAPFLPAKQGIVFDKKQAGLMTALAGSMQAMVKDGSYEKIMHKWKLNQGGLPQIFINSPSF
ncbi:MAG: ABC transporter substrate-binding protein [Microbacteriaceae bacterium]|nr:MAG: ABC transporter substrate-binding protein [Microbacteriaceae bacterium]